MINIACQDVRMEIQKSDLSLYHLFRARENRNDRPGALNPPSGLNNEILVVIPILRSATKLLKNKQFFIIIYRLCIVPLHVSSRTETCVVL